MSHYAASARRGDEEPAPTLPAAKSPTPLAASRRLLAVVAAGSLAAAIGAGGCGGSPERQPTGPFDVSTLGGAEAELTRAEASLARALGDPTLIADAAQTGSPIALPEPPPKETAQQAGGQPSPGTCETACDALASMRRAADRVCVLDAARCGPARARVERAAERVKASCSECE
jgi:hypothetical protein